MLVSLLWFGFALLCGLVIWMSVRPRHSSASVNFTCPTPSATVTEYKRDSVFPCNTHVKCTPVTPSSFDSITYYDMSGSICTTNDPHNFIIPVGPTVTAIYFMARKNSNVYHCWLCNINCIVDLLCLYNNQLTPFPFTIHSTTESPLFNKTATTVSSLVPYPTTLLGQNLLSNMGTFPNFMYIENFTTKQQSLECTVYVNLTNTTDDLPETVIPLTQQSNSNSNSRYSYVTPTYTNRIPVATTQSTGTVIVLAHDDTTYFGTILYKVKESQKLVLLPFGFVPQTPLLGLSSP
jgi:hypothetical protein